MIPIVAAFALAAALAAPALPDGRHDFDFEIGTWKIAPTGNLHVVRRLWDGATIAQLIVVAPKRHVRGSLLSLYSSERHSWSVYWADANNGTLSSPLTGKFRNGIGTFIGSEGEGRQRMLIRVVYDRITSQSFRTVQSESVNGGRKWKNSPTWTYTRRT